MPNLWMLDNGTDPAQIVVAGDSCGSGLALAVMLTLKEQEVPLPAGALMLCPGVDMTFACLDELPSEPQPALSLEQLRDFAAAYIGGNPADDPKISPLFGDLSGLPPMLIQGGTGDVFVSDAHRLADKARADGVDVQFELYPVPTHDFQIFWSFLPEAADAVHQAGQFARTVRTAARGSDAAAN